MSDEYRIGASFVEDAVEEMAVVIWTGDAFFVFPKQINGIRTASIQCSFCICVFVQGNVHEDKGADCFFLFIRNLVNDILIPGNLILVNRIIMTYLNCMWQIALSFEL